MTVNESARQLFQIMRSYGFEDRSIIRCLFSLYKISVHDVALRAEVSDQFVRQFLAGRRSSEKVGEVMKEMLFGAESEIDLEL
jgi:hypothetical protein